MIFTPAGYHVNSADQPHNNRLQWSHMFYFPIQMANIDSQLYSHLVFTPDGNKGLSNQNICLNLQHDAPPELGVLFLFSGDIGHRWCRNRKLLFVSILQSHLKFHVTRFNSSLFMAPSAPFRYAQLFTLPFSLFTPGAWSPVFIL
jgi:hypothetical protein